MRLNQITTVALGVCLLLVAGMPGSFAASPKDTPVNADVLNRLNRLEQQLQNRGLLDMLQQLEHLQHEVNRLQGEIEQQNHVIEQLKKRQRALYTDIDQRIGKMESGAGVAGAGSERPVVVSPPLETLPPVTTPAAPVTSAQQEQPPLTIETIEIKPVEEQKLPAQTPPAPQAPGAAAMPEPAAGPAAKADPKQIQEAYQQAFKLLKQSQYKQAIAAFKKFLQDNPDSEYSDNAQYWLGEAYYVSHDFKQALVEYDKLLNTYPNSRKVPHALLKKGYSYYELDQMSEAKKQLETLRQRFPGTTAARLAKERLKSIAAKEGSDN